MSSWKSKRDKSVHEEDLKDVEEENKQSIDIMDPETSITLNENIVTER